MQGRLERCILCFSITRRIREFFMFRVERKLYQFVCLCFGLALAPLVFTKVMEISIAVIRRLNWRIIIYIDNILIMTGFKKELLLLRHTLIFLRLNLGFVINFNNCVRPLPCVGISRTGNRLSVCGGGNSEGQSGKDQETMSISPLVRKSLCEGLSKVNGKTLLYGNGSSGSTSRIQGPSTRANYRSLHEGIIRKHIVLHKEAKVELDWWVQNMDLNNGRCILSTAPQILIQSDASKLG